MDAKASKIAPEIDLSPYRVFSRENWASLRADTPLTLTLEEITSIVDLLLADLNKRLADRRVTVKLDKKARDWVAEKGYDPVFGARPLKRFLQRNIETKLARALLKGDVQDGSALTFTIQGDDLAFKQQPAIVVK